MSTISSKQAKKQGFRNPDLVLVFTILIGTLAISGAFTGNVYLSHPESRGSVDGNVPGSDGTLFASDELYWDANCSHGWSSDSMCEDIVSRSRLCTEGFSSTYCSAYDEYLQEFHNQKSNHKNLNL